MDRVLKVKDFLVAITGLIITLITFGYNMGTWQGKIMQDVNGIKIKQDQNSADIYRIQSFIQGYPDYLDNKIDPMRKEQIEQKMILLQIKNDIRK